MHGGKAPRGKKFARSHGVYEQGLHADEHDVFNGILSNKLTSLDEDIAMVVIRLRRLCRAQATWEAQHGIDLGSTNDGLPVVEQEDEVSHHPGPDGSTSESDRHKIIRKRTDFGPEIRAERRLLAELIRTKVMLEAATHGEEARDQLAEDMRNWGHAALADLEGNGGGEGDSNGGESPASAPEPPAEGPQDDAEGE